MPSIRDLPVRLITPENAGLTIAVALSAVGAYAIQLRVSTGVAAFFGLLILGVSTSTTLTSHDLLGTRVIPAMGRASIACTATFIIYVGLLAVVFGRGGSFFDAAVAFTLIALVVEAVARTLD